MSTPEPKLEATITKKLRKLTLEWEEYKLELDITLDKKIDLIKLDMWLTSLFKAEFEKVQSKKSIFVPKITLLK